MFQGALPPTNVAPAGRYLKDQCAMLVAGRVLFWGLAYREAKEQLQTCCRVWAFVAFGGSSLVVSAEMVAVLVFKTACSLFMVVVGTHFTFCLLWFSG